MSKYIIQINGKIRSKIYVLDDASEEDVIEQAIADDNAQHYIKDKKIKSTQFVKDRLVNIVVARDE